MGGTQINAMVTYIIRRLLWSVLLLFVVSFITFVMFIVLPSADPAVLRAGRQPTPELIAAISSGVGWRPARSTAGSADGNRMNITNVMKLTTNSSRIAQSSRRMM